MKPQKRPLFTLMGFLLIVMTLLVACASAPPATVEATAEPEQEAAIDSDGQYGEAPMLAELVSAGALPPVEERLPVSPKVIPVFDEIGTYGGTLRLNDPGERLDTALRIRHTGLFRYNFTASETQPGLAERFEWSNGNRTLTIKLREGLKWSDGEPYTTADFMFYWDHVLNNEEISPNGLGAFWAPGGESATWEAIDDHTISFTWPNPNPGAMDRFGRTHFSSDNVLFLPAHYVQQFHADFNEEAQALAEAEGFESWVDLFNARRCQCYQTVSVQLDRPYMDSFIPVEIESDRILLQRNPYFHQVDPAGNQLPYMDQIEVSFVSDLELYNLRINSGEIDFGARFTNPSSLPLYRQGEAEGDYTTYIAQGLRPCEFCIYLNQLVEDLVLRELFQNLDFRVALSVAIDRQEMNDVLFFGLGSAEPATPLSTIPWFRDEWYNDFLDYDPDRANALLDGLGLTEKDAEGFRLRSDGERLLIPMTMNTEKETAGGLKFCELLADDYRVIGVEINCRVQSPDVTQEQRQANEHIGHIHHLGRATLFGRGTPDEFAFERFPANGWGTMWQLWNESDGAEGIEPPQEIKDLIALWAEFAQHLSDSAEAVQVGGDYYAYFADQLPIIPTIGLTPQPVIYSNGLRNVPTEDIGWASDTNFYAPFHVEQWYFVE